MMFKIFQDKCRNKSQFLREAIKSIDWNLSMNQKMGLQIVDQKKHLKKEKGTVDSMETKTILLDHDSWQTLMKGLKVEEGTGDSMEPKTISIDHDLKKTLMQKGKQLAVKWTQ